MIGSEQWVVIIADGRLAIVQKQTERGVEVRFPLGGRNQLLPSQDVRSFNPLDYPIQIHHTKRKEIKAKGEIPKDEIEKVCNQCLKLKPICKFAPNQTRKDGSTIYRPTCISCRKGIDGVKNHKLRRDGTKPIEPVVGSFWQCPICEKEGIVKVTVKIVLDHGHLTGDARDYICDSCNTGLGRFRNGKDFLRNAINYLNQWESNEND
ncbi:MAG: endonuclease domain-containing protein [Aestuariivita sp.]|nr:endonuclease domain-containing protein [Aestuariivita sp.]